VVGVQCEAVPGQMVRQGNPSETLPGVPRYKVNEARYRIQEKKNTGELTPRDTSSSSGLLTPDKFPH